MGNLTYIQVLVRIVSLAASAAEKETLTTKKKNRKLNNKESTKETVKQNRPAKQAKHRTPSLWRKQPLKIRLGKRNSVLYMSASNLCKDYVKRILELDK